MYAKPVSSSQRTGLTNPSTAKIVAVSLAVAVAVVLLVSGIAVFADADIWKVAAATGSLLSLALLLLFFHPWLTIGIAIDVKAIEPRTLTITRFVNQQEDAAQGVEHWTPADMRAHARRALDAVWGRLNPQELAMTATTASFNWRAPFELLASTAAKLFPLSLLLHGNALNITCVSYAGTLNFGFTGARDNLPHLQRLAVYMGGALEEIEGIVLGKRKRAKAGARQAR